MDYEKMIATSTEELAFEHIRLKVEHSYAKHATEDPEWIERIDHDLELIETELNRRMGDGAF